MTYDSVLGIDVGTSGVRAAVVSANGKICAVARAPHLPQPTGFVDARLWWDAVVNCLRRLATLCDLSQVQALAIDGTSGTLVLVDRALAPVTTAFFYNSTGFDVEAQVIDSVAPTPHITRTSSSALARALRLREMDKDRRGQHLLHQADYILARFAGRALGSDFNNALKTGFDPESQTWPDWFDRLDIPPHLLPDVGMPGSRVGTIEPAIAADLKLRADVALHLGTTDSLAAHIATGALRPGNAVTSLGTTLAMKIVSPRRIDVPSLGLYSHRVGASWLVGGASNSGGGVLAHYFTSRQLNALSSQIDPDQPTNFNYYPLLKPGERFPIQNPNHPPKLTPRPKKDHIFLQGLFEGMAEIEAQSYKKLVELGAPMPNKILSAGGGAKNKAWQSIRARIIGLPIENSPESEACIGVARLCFQSPQAIR